MQRSSYRQNLQRGYGRIVTKKPDYSSSGDEMSTLTRTSRGQSFSPGKKICIQIERRRNLWAGPLTGGKCQYSEV
jgi:hypothetical protein